MRTLKVLVYGDVDLNIMDGSAVWLTSMAGMLATNPDIQAEILLKARIKNTLLTDEMAGYPNVTIIQPYENLGERSFANGNRMNVAEAVTVMKELDAKNNYDLIIVRGFDLVRQLMQEGGLLVEKTVPYITDFSHTLTRSSRKERSELEEVYTRFPSLFMQTEPMKKSFMRLMDVDGAKIQILFPMVPNITSEPSFRNRNDRLIYTGKFATDWYTEEIVEVASELDEKITVGIAGDKFQGELAAKKAHIMQQFTEEPRIDWHGAMSRSASQQFIEDGDVGISWRSEVIDNDESVELSTKLLEYGRLGKPVLLRRTKMHEDLLGKDYPLFVDTKEQFVTKATQSLEDSKLYERAARMVYEASQHFTLEASYKRLSSFLWSYQKDRIRVVFAGHDLKFLTMAITACEANPQLEVKIDNWKGHATHDEKQSQMLLDWADVIFCEWGLGNAVWYSKHKKPHQKLIVRMHLQERETEYPANYTMDNIDQIIAISPYIFEEFHRVCKIPREKMTMIYNMIDTAQYRRKKTVDSRYNIGVCGILPSRKRLDLTLDILEKLWQKDKRYRLYVKSRMPQDLAWLMQREDEKKYYDSVFKRIKNAPWKDAVIFDEHGDDVADWMKKIGFMLSTSDFESFHLAPMEGMASGSVPCVLHWPGAETIYPEEHIFETTDAIAEYIRAYKQTPDKKLELRLYPQAKFDKVIICKKLENMIMGAFLNGKTSNKL
ncbi:glycosyltransferase family 4 protein [Listeria booriae]|uniref:glycosyltransferase family 4 protein n=1 Tax=Listeria booriae TaxID=1552123 RepID=UPI0016284445|nr:glycosyltransferase family 4 protein [Listeria booriae]MBC2149677.1 glycosyltransferase family 4 protein [Listeria booriae]